MQTATVVSFSQRAAAPSWPAYPALQEAFSDARYEVCFAQNTEELEAVLKLRFNVCSEFISNTAPRFAVAGH